MSIMIGHASIDENGKTSGGKAGDQTKKEVCKREFYVHKKGWVCLRPINSTVAEKIAITMEKCCDNNNIGYDQGQRLTLYDTCKALNFRLDISTLRIKVECDCSSLVRTCLAYAGIHVANFNTANEKSVLLNTKQFKEVEIAEDGSNLKRGDILVTKTKGHTAIILSNPKTEVQTVNIELEVLKKGSKGNQVKTLQTLLNSKDVDLEELTVDGDFGVKTDNVVKAYQKKNKLTVDGIVGKNTWESLLK